MNIAKRKLRSLMVLHGDTDSTLAKVLGFTPQTFNSKINERNGSEFSASDISKIKQRYKLDASEIEAIFFAREVS